MGVAILMPTEKYKLWRGRYHNYSKTNTILHPPSKFTLPIITAFTTLQYNRSYNGTLQYVGNVKSEGGGAGLYVFCNGFDTYPPTIYISSLAMAKVN
jgi:hypothetical protein